MATPVSNAYSQHDESSALCYLAGLLIPKIKGAFLSNRQINRKNRSGMLCPMLSPTPVPTRSEVLWVPGDRFGSCSIRCVRQLRQIAPGSSKGRSGCPLSVSWQD